MMGHGGGGGWCRHGGIPLTSVGPRGVQRACFQAGSMGPGLCTALCLLVWTDPGPERLQSRQPRGLAQPSLDGSEEARSLAGF